MNLSSQKKIARKFSSSNQGLTTINKWICRSSFFSFQYSAKHNRKREFMRIAYSRLPTFDFVADVYLKFL